MGKHISFINPYIIVSKIVLFIFKGIIRRIYVDKVYLTLMRFFKQLQRSKIITFD